MAFGIGVVVGVVAVVLAVALSVSTGVLAFKLSGANRARCEGSEALEREKSELQARLAACDASLAERIAVLTEAEEAKQRLASEKERLVDENGSLRHELDVCSSRVCPPCPPCGVANESRGGGGGGGGGLGGSSIALIVIGSLLFAAFAYAVFSPRRRGPVEAIPLEDAIPVKAIQLEDAKLVEGSMIY